LGRVAQRFHLISLVESRRTAEQTGNTDRCGRRKPAPCRMDGMTSLSSHSLRGLVGAGAPGLRAKTPAPGGISGTARADSEKVYLDEKTTAGPPTPQLAKCASCSAQDDTLFWVNLAWNRSKTMPATKFALALIACILSIALPSTVQAQTAAGAVTGTVTDGSGAVVQGASVTLTGSATNLSATTSTNATHWIGRE